MARLFGTDGVRGRANAELTAELALDLAVAAAHVLGEAGVFEGRRPFAVVGRDTRASGEFLEAAVVAGLASAGVDVVRLGVVPTPGVAFLTGHLDADFLGEMDEEQLDKLADDMGVDTTGKDKAEVVAAVAEEPVEVPDISKMKLDELKEFAEDNGIDLTG